MPACCNPVFDKSKHPSIGRQPMLAARLFPLSSVNMEPVGRTIDLQKVDEYYSLNRGTIKKSSTRRCFFLSGWPMQCWQSRLFPLLCKHGGCRQDKRFAKSRMWGSAIEYKMLLFVVGWFLRFIVYGRTELKIYSFFFREYEEVRKISLTDRKKKYLQFQNDWNWNWPDNTTPIPWLRWILGS